MNAPRAGLPDPGTSRAVLVGVSDYETLEELPSVERNVGELRRLLTDTELWGLPPEHCVDLVNPTSVEQVLEAVHTAASTATDALLFYFAGHGLLDGRGDLHLALSGADGERLFRAVRYDDVRREVVGATHVFGKVVILDSCFSGRAMQGGMYGSVDLADHARVDGTYLMTATAETKLALAPPGEKYTAFTGALVDRMWRGVPDGPDVLDMETLFHLVRADLRARHMPVPQQRTRNDGKAIALVRNRRGSGRGPDRELAAPNRELPAPPEGFAEFRRLSPSELARLVRELRSNGRDDAADQLLAASAALRADQEVAAIVDLLHRRDQTPDLRKVYAAVGLRPPVEVLRIVDVLRDTDLPDEAVQLLRVAGTGEAADVAGLARLLRAEGHTGDLVELLDEALETAREPSDLISLVNALWVAGLRQEVDGLVNRAMSKLPEPAVVELADVLRAVGREETAFGLYAAAAGRVAATRPPDAVAQLCRAMDATDREGERIAQALIDTVDGATRALEVTTAFWHADQGHHALRTLDRAAGSLRDSDVLALAAELRARGHDEAAYDLCLRRMVVRPGSVREIIGTLRDAGRPVDAKNLIKAVAGQAPAPVLLDLVTGWADADRERVLAAAVLRAPDEVADLLDTLRPTHPAIARQLMSLMTDTMPSQAEFLPILLSRVNPRARTELLAWTVSTTEGRTVVKGLSEAGLEHYADALLGETAASARRVHDIAAYLASLCDAGQSRAVRVLLRRALAGAGSKEVTELVAALRAQGHDPAIAAVAAWVRATTDGGEADVKYRLLRVGLKDFVVDRRHRW